MSTNSSIVPARTTLPIVVNIKVAHIRPQYNNLQEWMDDDNNYYIGRKGIVFIEGKRFPPIDSPFSNPFKIDNNSTRNEVIVKYEKYIRDKINNGEINLDIIRGKKRLGCWCKPQQCHGDVLIKLLQEENA